MSQISVLCHQLVHANPGNFAALSRISLAGKLLDEVLEMTGHPQIGAALDAILGALSKATEPAPATPEAATSDEVLN